MGAMFGVAAVRAQPAADRARAWNASGAIHPYICSHPGSSGAYFGVHFGAY